MGAHIHAHAEVRIDHMWHHYSVLNIIRDYDLFAKMADVRNNGSIIPISEPRGLPEDMTFMTWFDYSRWKADAHSMSWLSSEEMDSLELWYIKERYDDQDGSFHNQLRFADQFGYIFGNGWDVKKYPEDYPKGVEDSRLIFWFDN